MKNIFIEGIQGSGKSTLLDTLETKLKGYQAYREGDLSPVELAWNSYMTSQQFMAVCDEFPMLKTQMTAHLKKEDDRIIVAYTQIHTDNAAFFKKMEQYEIYNKNYTFQQFQSVIESRFERYHGDGAIFECSFLQNIVECLMLFYEMNEDEIIEFYKRLFTKVDQDKFILIYLESSNLREEILQIKKERVDENKEEIWYPMMLAYLLESPYGKAHHKKGFEDLLSHFERRKCLEKRIITEVIGDKAMILPAKRYSIDHLVQILY